MTKLLPQFTVAPSANGPAGVDYYMKVNDVQVPVDTLYTACAYLSFTACGHNTTEQAIQHTRKIKLAAMASSTVRAQRKQMHVHSPVHIVCAHHYINQAKNLEGAAATACTAKLGSCLQKAKAARWHCIAAHWLLETYQRRCSGEHIDYHDLHIGAAVSVTLPLLRRQLPTTSSV